LPTSRQKNYLGTGIVTKQLLKNILTARNKVIKKTNTNITIYGSTGTQMMTRENVAKSLVNFFWNTTPATGNILQILKNNYIITNTSYPKNRELNQNLLIMLARFYKQQNGTGIINTGSIST